MNPILDKITHQMASGRAFTQSKSYGVLDQGRFPKFHWDLYPLNQPYYHELNPVFLANLYKKDLLRFTEVITVRDGKLAFANFLLSNVESILESQTHFLIPKDFTDLIPSTLKDQFSCWNKTLKKPRPITEAKRIVIFGLLIEKYYGSLETIKKNIQRDFKSISQETEIEVLLPLRNDPFKLNQKESLLHFEVYECLKDALGERSFKVIKLENFFERSLGSEDFLYDLRANNLIVSDSYMDYFFASKGAGVNTMTSVVPQDSFKSFSISFWHDLNIMPCEHKNNSKFAELLLYKRLNSKDLITDKNFQKIISG